MEVSPCVQSFNIRLNKYFIIYGRRDKVPKRPWNMIWICMCSLIYWWNCDLSKKNLPWKNKCLKQLNYKRPHIVDHQNLYQSVYRFNHNELSTENRLRSQRISTPYKIKANNCILIDLVIRIELTRAILMQWYSIFLKNSTIHFLHVFLYNNMFLTISSLFTK